MQFFVIILLSEIVWSHTGENSFDLKKHMSSFNSQVRSNRNWETPITTTFSETYAFNCTF